MEKQNKKIELTTERCEFQRFLGVDEAIVITVAEGEGILQSPVRRVYYVYRKSDLEKIGKIDKGNEEIYVRGSEKEKNER